MKKPERKTGKLKMIALLTLLALCAADATAQEAPSIDAGDTSWLLVSTALVMLMTPAVGFFYGGMVRKKNVLSILTQSIIILSLVSIQWILFGYTLAFGTDMGGLIGGLDYLGLAGVGIDPSPIYGSTVPHMLFMMFQAMFAIITPALIIGAFTDRIKLSTLIAFTLIWTTVVYDPVAHWVWGAGGWIGKMGALDFAGGTVVHITAGISALAAAIVVGKRKGFGKNEMPPHNVPMVILGGALLWFGWFGFNAGSALGANGLAASAFLVTNTAAAAAALTWMAISWFEIGKPNSMGIITGAVAGLVAITPASGFVGPIEAIAIGIGAGLFCYAVMYLKNKSGTVDDSLDVFACHGVGGIWGAVATGIFASETGLLYASDGMGQLISQVVAIVAVAAYSFVATVVIFKVLDALMGARVSCDEEVLGLDVSQHRERAYA